MSPTLWLSTVAAPLHCTVQALPLSREAEEERLLAEQKAHQFKARPYDKYVCTLYYSIV
jgi:hypothetical protein